MQNSEFSKRDSVGLRVARARRDDGDVELRCGWNYQAWAHSLRSDGSPTNRAGLTQARMASRAAASGQAWEEGSPGGSEFPVEGRCRANERG